MPDVLFQAEVRGRVLRHSNEHKEVEAVLLYCQASVIAEGIDSVELSPSLCFLLFLGSECDKG